MFCNRCGAPLVPAPAPASAPPGPGASAGQATEPEQELWKGRYSGKSAGHLWILWILWLAALAFGWFRFQPETGFSPHMKWVFLAAAALPALGILWSWFSQWVGTRYRLTNYRLFKEQGVLFRRLNEVELIRVDDVAVRQNLMQRIFNVGVVTVIAPTDATEPRVELVGIEDPIVVKELIRAEVRKRRSRSLHVESL